MDMPDWHRLSQRPLVDVHETYCTPHWSPQPSRYRARLPRRWQETRLADCLLAGNTAAEGGAMYMDASLDGSHRLTLTNTRLQDNRCTGPVECCGGGPGGVVGDGHSAHSIVLARLVQRLARVWLVGESCTRCPWRVAAIGSTSASSPFGPSLGF